MEPPAAAPLDELARLEAEEDHGRPAWPLLLLLLPVAAIAWPPLYNHATPALGGLPFWVWYQLAAVTFGGLVTGVVYLLRGAER